MIGKFDIEFEVNGISYTATAENYLNPGQIRVIDITPSIPDFPDEITFDKNHTEKTLIYDKLLDQATQVQILEAVHRKAKEEGRPLYLGEVF